MASLCTLRMRNLPWILQGGGAAGRQFAGIARAARRLGMGGHLDSPYCVCGRGVLRLVGAGCAACEEGLGLAQTREKVGLGDEILRGEERTQPAAKRRLIFRFFWGIAGCASLFDFSFWPCLRQNGVPSRKRAARIFRSCREGAEPILRSAFSAPLARGVPNPRMRCMQRRFCAKKPGGGMSLRPEKEKNQNLCAKPTGRGAFP